MHFRIQEPVCDTQWNCPDFCFCGQDSVKAAGCMWRKEESTSPRATSPDKEIVATRNTVSNTVTACKQLTRAQLFKNFHVCYLCLTFTIAFTEARQWCLYWRTWIKSKHSHRMSLRVTLILSYHLCLRLLSSLLLPSGFPANFFLFAFLFPPSMLHVSANLILFDLISLRIFCSYNFEAFHYADGQDSAIGLATCYGLEISRFESW
jgi:hypothetical protein